MLHPKHLYRRERKLLLLHNPQDKVGTHSHFDVLCHFFFLWRRSLTLAVSREAQRPVEFLEDLKPLVDVKSCSTINP
jgi:hypothetical protein